MEVEFTHDIACVWSALAYIRFRRAAEEHRAGGGELEVDFRPYETEPSSTETPSGRGQLQPAPAARIEQIARAAAADGLVVNLDRIVPAHTGEAHRLIALAAAQGNAEDMTARLYRAYFSDGLDIGDVNVLRGLASAIGVRWDGERPRAEPARPRSRVRPASAGLPFPGRDRPRRSRVARHAAK
ncbi:putative DsbA family dithiol-disulfide isomerase [Actinomadura luteofluorescens]|uniref:Putative DsbA family dithiol-disulfide isomerase n=1 Tax=Actinomadura luteofluorescens TaxID=46163 RepID=A0A7Y9EB66_9ACTN|nr:DsbA family protein [Actinomadura luteofluorescens]NYD44580.1 putative DsbA family dithiol-disulfide isomerase [Actinomadura luteofluorescens]